MVNPYILEEGKGARTWGVALLTSSKQKDLEGSYR